MKGIILLKRKLRGLDLALVAYFMLFIVLVALLVGCGMPGDPILDNLYTQNIYPGATNEYSIGSEDLVYDENWFGATTFTGQITLEDDGKVWLELRPDTDFETVRAQGKPTWVTRGVGGGFSLPIYAANNEELYFNMHIPARWDGESDIVVHIHGYLDTANTDKKFQLRVAWESWTPGTDIMPAISNNVDVETTTGTWAQYQTYSVMFTIDYDIDSPSLIKAGDCLCMRLRRIDASGDEIAGEVVICHVGVNFIRDKLGSSTS